MKLFGLFPFKVKYSKKRFNLVYCCWGAVLTVFHVLTYAWGFIIAVKRQNQSAAITVLYDYSTTIKNLQTNFSLIQEGSTVFIILGSIIITNKIQRNMLKLLNRIECILEKKSLHLEVLHVYLISFLMFLNLFGVFIAGLITLIFHPYPYSFLYTIVRITPHIYIFIKVSQFVLYFLLLNLGFTALNNVV